MNNTHKQNTKKKTSTTKQSNKLAFDDYELSSLKLLFGKYYEPKQVKEIKQKITFTDNLYKTVSLESIINYAENLKEEIKAASESKAYVYQIVDIYSLFYFDIFDCRMNIKSELKSGWNKFVKKLLELDKIVEMNRTTRGNHNLAEIATIQFFIRLSNVLRKMFNLNVNDLQRLDEQQVQQIIGNQQFINEVDSIIEMLKEEMEEVKKDVEETKEVIEQLQNIMKNKCCKNVQQGQGNGNVAEAIKQIVFSGSLSYGRFSLEYITYYGNRSELRKKISKLKMFIDLYKIFKAKVQSKLEGFGVETEFGKFRSLERIRTLSELRNALPSNFALHPIMVVERIATLRMTKYKFEKKPKFRIYIDKSGSMACGFGVINGMSVNKIDAACALAFALWSKHETEIYFFDTVVYELSPHEVLKALLEAAADYGTNITEVLEHLHKRDKGDYNIVITDGIDEVDESFARKIAREHNVIFILIPPCADYSWLSNFKRFYVKNVNDMLAVVDKLL